MRRPVFLSSAAALVALSAVIGVHLASAPVDPAEPVIAGQPPALAVAVDAFDRFHIDQIVSKDYVGPRLLYEMTATKVVHRKRRSELFEYQNLKEIVFRNVRIDFYPDLLPSATVSGAGVSPSAGVIQLPMAMLVGGLFPQKDGLSFETASQYMGEDPDINLDLLSRVSVEDMAITLHLADGRRFSLTAAGAKINTDPENVLLDGGFLLTTPADERLSAPKAIWSSRYGGFYLPGPSYLLNGRTCQGPAFYKLHADGRMTREEHVPEIRFVDLIEEKEATLLREVTKDVPIYLRAMLGGRQAFESQGFKR